MEYLISVGSQTERSEAKGLITFKWNVKGKDFNFEKVIAFSVNEFGCYIPEIESRTWGGIGVMTIKEAMGLPDTFCCCNPEHTEENMDSMSIEFGRRISKEVHLRQPFVKTERKDTVSAKEKISDDGAIGKVDGRSSKRMLSANDVDMIKSSKESDSELAKIFCVSRDYINKIKRGIRR